MENSWSYLIKMGLWKWAEKSIKKMTLWDYALLKIVLILIGIIIGAYIATFVKDNIWYFGSIAILGYIILLTRVLKK